MMGQENQAVRQSSTVHIHCRLTSWINFDLLFLHKTQVVINRNYMIFSEKDAC